MVPDNISLEETELHYRTTSENGELFEEFLRSRGWQAFKTQILDEMYKGAFDLFQKIDPTDSSKIIETQQMGKVIKGMEAAITSKIQEGRAARINLATLPTMEE